MTSMFLFLIWKSLVLRVAICAEATLDTAVYVTCAHRLAATDSVVIQGTTAVYDVLRSRCSAVCITLLCNPTKSVLASISALVSATIPTLRHTRFALILARTIATATIVDWSSWNTA